MSTDVKLESVITCPNCGHQKREIMEVDSCRYFYQCDRCHSMLKPLPGDCCVFCSYGTEKCPPKQLGDDCCK